LLFVLLTLRKILHIFTTNICLAVFVHQSVTCNNFRIIEQICIKFDTGGFYYVILKRLIPGD